MMRKNGKSKKTGIFGLRNKIYLCFLVPIAVSWMDREPMKN